MRKLVYGSIGLIAMATSASAADLAARPYTKAPAMVAMYDWSGFYLGANGGWGTSRKCWDLTNFVIGGPVVPNLAEGCHDASGGTVGGQIGYRWQASSWVFGLEAQGNWADFKGSNISNQLISRNESKVEAFGLFTGQVGYAWNNVLLYVKGGAAVTSDKYTGFTPVPGIVPAGTAFDSGRETRWGAAVGAGLEYGLTANWTVGVEYNHLFMGNRDVTMTSTGTIAAAGAFVRTDRIRQDVDIVTARINYKFGGPVVARY